MLNNNSKGHSLITKHLVVPLSLFAQPINSHKQSMKEEVGL